MSDGCPCGCGRLVTPGNTYAARGCATRGKPRTAAQKPLVVNPAWTAPGALKRATPVTSSWWMGATREEFAEEVRKRYDTAKTRPPYTPGSWECL